MSKILTVSIVVILALALLTMTVASSDVLAQSDKKKPQKQCNNVKVQVKINGVEENQTVITSATLGGKTVTKTQTVDENETSITAPLNFKKISPCPTIGESIFGNVNGTGFTGELKSLKKPNKITVNL
ncbi:MAG TPA: hypothetical protein VL854_06725 [Nitrososphaeraceae archaeon]|jgi:hypothetical protein|nr:hypothetical protein [Nitrososphaeraceae archaeon]